MTRRYVLAPEAALDLVQILRYLKEQIVSILHGRRDVEQLLRDRL